MQKIVVGVDGSEGSQRALQWAIEEAGRRDATVEALHAWEPGLTAGLYSGAVFTEESVQEAGERVLDDTIAAADPAGSTKVERRCVTAQPAAAWSRSSCRSWVSRLSRLVTSRVYAPPGTRGTASTRSLRPGPGPQRVLNAEALQRAMFTTVSGRPRRGTVRDGRPGCSPTR